MAILKKQELPVAIIEKDFLEDNTISLPAKGLLAIIKAFSEETANLDKLCNKDDDYIEYYLNELVEKDYLIIEQQPNGEYYIFETDREATEEEE